MRGRLLRNGGILCLLLLLAACTQAPSERARNGSPDGGAGPPNVLVIVTDDQRAKGTLGVMRETRRLFGERGMRFTNAYATTPLCCPSRASIFTGQYAHNHAVIRNDRESTESLRQRSTVQHYLQEAGYRTAIFGKYLNEWRVSRRPPNFDEWAIFPTGQRIPHRLNYRGAKWNVRGTVRKVHEYSTTFISRLSLRFLTEAEEEDSRPWALYVTVYAPHSPSVTERKYSDASVPTWRPSPAVGEHESAMLQGIRGSRRAQLRSLMSVDDLVQRLFARLVELREARSTLAFYLSDNGYLWGERGAIGKGLPYTESIHIPLLVRWPGHVAEGEVEDALVSNIDIAPTILRAARVGLRSRRAMDGAPLFGGTARRRLLIELVPTEDGTGRRSWAGIRTTTFQYIENYGRQEGMVSSREFYDLDRDPWSLENLLHDADPTNDPAVRRLSRLLSRLKRCRGEDCP